MITCRNDEAVHLQSKVGNPSIRTSEILAMPWFILKCSVSTGFTHLWAFQRFNKLLCVIQRVKIWLPIVFPLNCCPHKNNRCITHNKTTTITEFATKAEGTASVRKGVLRFTTAASEYAELLPFANCCS